MTHRPPFNPDHEPFDSAWAEQNAALIRAEKLRRVLSFVFTFLITLVLLGVALFVGRAVGASIAHHDTKPAWAYERVNR